MRILTGYFLIALSVVLFLSLISFNPADSSLFVSNISGTPDNIAGNIGVWLSSPVILLYGKYGGYLLDFGMLVIGVNIIIKAKIGRILIKTTLFFISTICLSVILSGILKNPTFNETGLFGISVYKSLTEIINPYVVLVLFSLILILSLSSTMKLFQKLTMLMAKAFGAIVLAPFELFGLIVNKNESVSLGTAGVQNLPEEFEEIENIKPAFSETGNLHDDQFEQERRQSIQDNPVPDFLQTVSSRQTEDRSEDKIKEGIGRNLSNKAVEGVPEWLKDERSKQNILDQIKKHFDKEIEFNNSVPNTDQIPHNTNEEKKIEPELINPIDNLDKTNFILSDKENITAADPDEAAVEEIVGEADYAEEALHRIKTEDEEEISGELFHDGADYKFPEMNILEQSFDEFSKAEENQETEKVSQIIENTFASFKIDIKVSGHSRGPAITRYEIIPPSGLKLKNIVNLTDDLALNLGTRNIRIVAPIGNKSIIGVEVPNKFRRSVVLRDIIDSEEFKKNKARLPLILGKDIAGNIVIEDLTEMPHLLIAGTTGSGKSVYVNSLIGGLVYTKSSSEVRFIFIDPKMVELELYNGIPHLLAPVITNPEEAIAVLEWASAEMDRRYKEFSEYSVRNIVDYNKEIKKINLARSKNEEALFDNFPYIVIVIDEFANLMLRLPKETEKIISRIAAMARAVGIHLVVATQRPSVDVVTGIIKANFPSRIAFRVSSQTDSRTILDKNGAEKLLGRGDMLFMTPNFTDMLRIQSPYVSNIDVENIVKELKRNGAAEYEIDVETLMVPQAASSESEFSVDYKQDPVFADSIKAAVENGEISASYLQRRFRIGYNRASRIIEAMDRMKILGPSTGNSKPREVIIRQEDLVNYLN